VPALLIAVITILVPLLVTYYAFERSLPFLGGAYTDYAVVPNSVNVRVDSPVRIAGVDVGAVSTVTPDGRYSKIAFTLDGNALPIHTDATVTVRDRLFLEGGYYLALEPGSPSAPVASEGFTIQPRATQTPVQFFQLLSTFDIAARASLENLLNTANQAFSPAAGQPFRTSGAAGLKQAIPALTPVLKDASWVSQALTGTHAGDVQTLLTSASAVSTTLDDHEAELTGLLDALDETSGALAAGDNALADSVTGLDQTLQEAPATLHAVDASLTPLTNLSAALTPSLRKSPALVSALTSEVESAIPIIGPANRGRLLSSVQTLLARFPDALSLLAKLFPVTQQVSECLGTHITPALEAKVNDGSLSTGEQVWEDFVHGMIGLASASGDYDANGHYLRVIAGLTTLTGGLGSLPGVGQLVGTIAGTGSSSTSSSAVSPQWVGDLPSSDWRPDVPCSSQPLLPATVGPTP
jgi:virulence factor Mce-like protein